MKRFLTILAICLLAMIPIIPVQETYASLVLVINPGENSFTINSETHKLRNPIITDNQSVFVPLREVFTGIGYTVEWDASANAAVCKGDGNQIILILAKDRINVNSQMHNVKVAPFFHNDTLYISSEILQKSTALEVKTENFTPSKYDSGVASTVIDDSMRTETVSAYGTIRISGTRAMEAIVLTGIDDYASLISQASALLPECNVYNMVVPTGAEFYAEQGKGVKDDVALLYSKLDDSVIPVNVFDILNEHKGENIYFRTDHHWTQRGAYYAYTKFLEHSHRELPPLSQFPVETKEYTGSMANFLAKTPYAALMRNNPDEIEYFKPIVKTDTKVYSDRWMANKTREVSAVSASGGYLGFIGGDSPLTVIKTDCESDRKLLIVKESYGNALAPWAANNYREIYIVDPRHFGSGTNPNSFKLVDFYNYVKVDDVLFINYPGGVSSPDFRNAIRRML